MEIWKDIEGYEGIYAITEDGRVKNLRNNYMKKPSVGANGYLSLNLEVNYNIKNVRLHRLLAIAFIPNPENKPQVNHVDGDKLNNTLSNLEWSTSRENLQHAYDTGLKAKGANHYKSKLTVEQRLEVVELAASGLMTQRAIGQMFDMSHSGIQQVIKKYKASSQ